MKKLLVFAVTFVLCGIVSVQAAGDEKNGHAYFTKAELPNMANILPAPPAFESARFVADQSQYLWGKLMRLDEARCAQAQRDAVYSMETIIAEFSGIFGLEITKEDTPEIYTILQDVCASCDSIHTDAKVFFNRMRPYTYYNAFQKRKKSTVMKVPILQDTPYLVGLLHCCWQISTLLQRQWKPCWHVAMSSDRAASSLATTGKATSMQVEWLAPCSIR